MDNCRRPVDPSPDSALRRPLTSVLREPIAEFWVLAAGSSGGHLHVHRHVTDAAITVKMTGARRVVQPASTTGQLSAIWQLVSIARSHCQHHHHGDGVRGQGRPKLWRCRPAAAAMRRHKPHLAHVDTLHISLEARLRHRHTARPHCRHPACRAHRSSPTACKSRCWWRWTG